MSGSATPLNAAARTGSYQRQFLKVPGLAAPRAEISCAPRTQVLRLAHREEAQNLGPEFQEAQIAREAVLFAAAAEKPEQLLDGGWRPSLLVAIRGRRHLEVAHPRARHQLERAFEDEAQRDARDALS